MGFLQNKNYYYALITQVQIITSHSSFPPKCWSQLVNIYPICLKQFLYINLQIIAIYIYVKSMKVLQKLLKSSLQDYFAIFNVIIVIVCYTTTDVKCRRSVSPKLYRHYKRHHQNVDPRQKILYIFSSCKFNIDKFSSNKHF